MSDELDLENLQQAEGEAEGEILIEKDERREAQQEAAGKMQAAGGKKIINALRFTLDEWKKQFPDLDEKKWWDAANPYCMNIFLSGTMINLRRNNREVDALRIIVIDEEYRAWLEKNGKESSEKTLDEYARSISDKDAYRLLEKNHMNSSIEFLALPVILIRTRQGRQNFYLKKSIAQSLTSYFEKYYGEGNVYIPRYILTFAGTRNLEFDHRELTNLSADWFNEGKKDVAEDLKTQRLANARTFAYIPIAVRVIHTKAVYGAGQIAKEEAAEFNPCLTLGENRKTESLPCIEDLGFIEGYKAEPAPEVLNLQTFYIQLNTMFRDAARRRREEAEKRSEEERKQAGKNSGKR